MPFTYHYRNHSPSSVDDLLALPQQESLQDDSIVLSDLIRTGETSRLRRRGAMRIEPTGATGSRHRWRSPIYPQGPDDAAHGDSPGYTWTIVENRSHRIPRHLPMLEVSDYDLEDYDSDSGDEMVFSASFNRAISEQTGHPVASESAALRSRSSNESVSEKQCMDNTPYTLVCGGPVDDTAVYTQVDPGSVYSALASFILPQSPLPQSGSSSQRSSTELNDLNGCGIVIHTRAFPRYRHHQPMWTANAPASEVVVPLERVYFDDICAKEQLSPKMIKQETCGCLRVGIGCANCGNPLGFRLTPCKTLRGHITSRQSRLRRRHSNASISSLNESLDDQDLYLYTFFCNSTTSPQTSRFPAAEPTSWRRRDWSRPRTYPLLPPPPPLIRLMSDSEMSDSDEEVVIDFRTPESSLAPTRILGGDVTASPEPTVIRLEPNPAPMGVYPTRHPSPVEEADSELGQARASWANVVRGVEAAASSLGANLENQAPPQSAHHLTSRLRRRRDALGLDPEHELGLASTTADDQPEGTASASRSDIPSILFEQSTVTLTPPPPELRSLPQSTSSDTSSDSEQNTPRPAVWDVSFADGHPSTSFWGRPAPGSNQWTWSNELAEREAERERDRNRDSGTRMVFDPDGEFLEGLEGEWGEEMARRLGFNSSMTEEKSEGGETSTTTGGLWWQ